MGDSPSKEMAEKMTRARVAFALLCGLAVCCSVMYITADGESETALASKAAKSVYGIGGPSSVDSTDVQKAGTVFTNTPDGRMRLTWYLINVEKEIAAEEAARKRDVAAVRAQMARNFAFNMAARKKLKKFLLAKMAANAKKAKKDLDIAMRRTQAQFAAVAALANKRNAANIARSKKIRKVVAANKVEAARNLHTQVIAQQRAMAALKSKVNARIDQTNKHVAANAAQIKENAKAARKALEKAVNIFDKKTANAREEAQKGRSKLGAQLAAQDKAVRQWANNKLKIVVASTAAHFRRVRAKMAADRAHADALLKSTTSRMTASLNAEKALRDSQFAKTVKDIASAKAEAKARVAAASAGFKVGIRRLRATVDRQVAKTNARITDLSGVVEKNKLAQAKVNNNVAAEMKRMISLGNKRYQEHLKHDKELESLINKNKATTDARLDRMAAHFAQELDKVRGTMKKNRAHATHMLKKETGKLYAAIAKGEKLQAKTNAALSAQTRQARLDIQDALRAAKKDFGKRLGALHTTVVKNNKKFEKKMDKLTGIVRANAVKSAKGRAMLASVMKSNKEELKASVAKAIARGESRMAAAESKLKDLKAKFAAASNKEAAAAAKNAAARAALAGKIAADKKFAARALKDAVGGLTRSLLALKTETSKKIKKTNSKVGAYADRLAAQAKAVDAAMKANVASARASVKAATGAANAASAARFGAVLKEVGAAMTAAKTADTNLKAAVVTINDKIAKQAALADSRFSKTVKDISAARKEAASEVAQARKSFSTSLAAVTAAVKDQETRLSGEIQVVSGEVLSHKASQIRVNRHTQAELKRITKLANARHSESVRARGKLRAIPNENKRAAHEEVVALDGLFKGKIAKIRAQAAANSLAAARDLSAASKGMYEKLARNQLEMTAANNANAAAIASYSSKAAAATATAKANMNGALNNLANTVASNQKHVEKGLEVLTGVVRSYKAAGKADRALIRAQTKAIGQDLNKRIVRAIQIGEAKARRVANRARVNLANQEGSPH